MPHPSIGVGMRGFKMIVNKAETRGEQARVQMSTKSSLIFILPPLPDASLATSLCKAAAE